MSPIPVSIGSGVLCGVDALPVTVEATLRGATGTPRILGRVDPVVREAYHRITTAFGADGLPTPRGVPTINFAPANVPKGGSGFDLPMALALAGAGGMFAPERAARVTALGELSLHGRVLPARGAVAVAIAAAGRGRPRLLLSEADAPAAACVEGVEVFAVAKLRDALLWLCGDLHLPRASPARVSARPDPLDLADIRGHETPKSALAVAAAGRHNVLFAGPPGSGKSALARRMAGLLPLADPAEALEILKIRTVASGASGWTGARPFRAPHHSSSHASLLGGGSDPRPGEVTLAHHGVLFLDEIAEFRREALEGLRQPLEDGVVTIGRSARTVTMPADFVLVAAMNPCPCGYLGHPERPCLCSPSQRRRYAARLSGPLLDRFALQVEVPASDPATLLEEPDPRWSTSALRAKVLVAVDRQRRRNRNGTGWTPNGRLDGPALDRAVGRDRTLLRTLEHVLRAHSLSGRARVRLLRIARTVADLADRDSVLADDLLSAARLRGVERLWAA